MNLEELFSSSMKKPKSLLDLSKVKIFSDIDLARYIDKVPEIKMTPDEFTEEEVKAVADPTFTISNKDRLELTVGNSNFNFPYGDPMPFSMRGVRMEGFNLVQIHWKMLTDLRPVSKTEDEYFSRLVQLGKFRYDTRIQEANSTAAAIASLPGGSGAQAKALTMGFIIYKSKRGTLETKLKTCKECGLELCTGAYCKTGDYESSCRVFMDKDELEAEDAKGFSLKSVIAEANATADGKKKPPPPATKNKKPLKAMIVKANRKPRKKKKKAPPVKEETV